MHIRSYTDNFKLSIIICILFSYGSFETKNSGVDSKIGPNCINEILQTAMKIKSRRFKIYCSQLTFIKSAQKNGSKIDSPSPVDLTALQKMVS